MDREDRPTEIRHDSRARKFFTEVAGKEAYLAYEELEPGKLDYRSTFVPPEGRGRGLGVLLVEEALAWAAREGYKVVPTCPFVADYMAAQPRYQELRA